jgi:hypothetical protein
LVVWRRFSELRHPVGVGENVFPTALTGSVMGCRSADRSGIPAALVRSLVRQLFCLIQLSRSRMVVRSVPFLLYRIMSGELAVPRQLAGNTSHIFGHC